MSGGFRGHQGLIKVMPEPTTEEQKRMWLDSEGKGLIPPLKEK